MLDESSRDTLLPKGNNNDIIKIKQKWHANDFCGYLTLTALLLSFTIYNISNNRVKWQNLKQEKISAGRKIIFKKISLLFFGVNLNVLEQTSLQALWNMSQLLKHWPRVLVLSSININIKKWFLNLIILCYAVRYNRRFRSSSAIMDFRLHFSLEGKLDYDV